MIFGKDTEEIKEILKSSEEKLKQLVEKLEKNDSIFDDFKKDVSSKIENIDKKKNIESKNFEESLSRIISIADEFERSIDSFNNIKNRLDDSLLRKITELTDTEIAAIRKKMNEINEVEGEFKELVLEVSRLKSEISKFNEASLHIKEIDFTLHKHARDLEIADRKKLELEKENEMLKSVMAKMQRGMRKTIR
jgi:hypothetical protein